jgi:G:T/U-mismatch repair DNA glycosylase
MKPLFTVKGFWNGEHTASFAGFKELPEPSRDFWRYLGIAATKDKDIINRAWKAKAREHFNNEPILKEVNIARDKAIEYSNKY